MADPVMGEPVVFFGALSFEDRATGALAALATRQRKLSGIMLDYGSEATPGREAATLRNRQWERVAELASENGWTMERCPVNPYSMTELEEMYASASSEAARVVVDISCMTKVHVITSATWLCLRREFASWSVAYTRPRSYGNTDGRAGIGWRGTLTLPLGETLGMSNEGIAFGWVIAGTEGARTAVALDEIEPSAGVFSIVRDPRREDLFQRTVDANSATIRHLNRLRLGGTRVASSRLDDLWPSLGWRITEVDSDRLISGLRDELMGMLPAVSHVKAPIILYPLGPKLAVFGASALLVQLYPTASWTIYPVVATHPLDFSYGVTSVRWSNAEDFDIRNLDQM